MARLGLDATVSAIVTGRPHNLPAHLPSLIGREEALAHLRQQVLQTDAGLLTLTGAGGSGKTRLALAIANEVLDDFPNGVWLAQLAPTTEATLVPGVVATSIGIVEQLGRPIRDTLLHELQGRSLLLVLDNCEHLVDAAAALVDEALRRCPRLRILATSREPLRIPGERVWRVPPLPTPDASLTTSTDQLTRNPCVRLFVERALAVQPALPLGSDNVRRIALVCARLDGLPLAIELAAARTRVLTPDQILARLDDTFRLLVGGSRTAPTRQQTLRATLDWSYLLLDAEAQTCFETLAVFAGGFDINAVQTIWDEGSEPGTNTLDALTGLVDRSLVTAQPQAGGMRYRLLEPVRQYAEERLNRRGAWDQIRRRHADYFLRLAEQAEQGLQSADQEVWVARLQLEHDNLRAALRRCLDGGEAATALRMASALRHFWRTAGYRNEGRQWIEDALASGADAPAAVLAKALQASALMAYSVSEFSVAKERFERAAVLCRQLGDTAGLGATLTFLGRLVARTATTPHEHQRGEGMLEEAISLSRQTEKLWYAGLAMTFLGSSRWEYAELEPAAGILDEAEAMLRQIGEQHLHGHVLANRGGVARDRGDLVGAQQQIEESLRQSRTLECLEGTAEALYFLAGVSRLRREPGLATQQATECLFHQHHLNIPAEFATTAELLGGLACDQKQPEQATMFFATAASLREKIGVPMPPILRTRFEQDLATARGALGAIRFDAAWAAGARMNMDQLVDHMRRVGTDSGGPRQAQSDPLSKREREVAALIARGYTNRQIAEDLVISERTADGHVANILAKLGLRNRAHVVIWATEHGLGGRPA
ncbi:MAG TPA: LuxR C-terminal-related transcriptional regulator [Ktedonobacterales bacterium]|nr:LuxR C-terminal-related transcriptional regulator [Ktedonobacterales bacterium]